MCLTAAGLCFAVTRFAGPRPDTAAAPPRVAPERWRDAYHVADGIVLTRPHPDGNDQQPGDPGQVDALDVPKAYARAEQLGAQVKGKVFKATVTPHWFQNNTRFWYRNDLQGDKKEFIVVDVGQGTRGPAFDHEKLAAALSAAAGAKYEASRLPFNDIAFVDGGKAIRFQIEKVSWHCDLGSYECTRSKKATEEEAPAQAPEPPAPVEDRWGHDEPGDEELSPEEQPQKGTKKKGPPPGQALVTEAKSPDGKLVAFIKSGNVYLRDADGKETQVTQNGVAGNAYAGLVWSPDGKAVLACRVEPGDGKEVYLIETCPKDQLRAKLRQRPYPQPGDRFALYEWNVIDVAAKQAVKVEVERFDSFKGPPRVRWRKGGRHALYEQMDRGYQRYRFIEIDAHTGAARAVIDEKAQTFIDHYTYHYLQFLPDTDEAVYVSEADGWKHIYLYDVKEGKLKHQVTQGAWVVRGIDRVDVAKRQIWFRGSGKVAGQDPYLVHYYRVNFDGSDLVALTEGDGNHFQANGLQFSPDRKYFIDTYSRVDMAPVHELRRVADGKLVCALEKADVSALEATGWRYPEVFHAKARDGKTDIWGIVCRPQQYDAGKKYPVIEYIYAGPHSAHVPKTFSAYRQMAALAELGFIVVQIDGMGTAHRARAFHDVCWKNLADAGFPDRILWIQALAAKYAYVDTTRVGIYGTSAGGQNALGALLFHPDFYKVAVSACGCHDNRIDKWSWNEAWMGLLGKHYEAQSNVTNAHKLQGKLLLILGELDTNVPPESTYRVVDALIKARKDFDLLVVPGLGHSSGGLYGDRRRNDFFVRHLHGVEPPNRNVR
jgi:dipeptidyl aminopeptidase/acylaminoacyl peptidase